LTDGRSCSAEESSKYSTAQSSDRGSGECDAARSSLLWGDVWQKVQTTLKQARSWCLKKRWRSRRGTAKRASNEIAPNGSTWDETRADIACSSSDALEETADSRISDDDRASRQCMTDGRIPDPHHQ
jgi:hypothetical protein